MNTTFSVHFGQSSHKPRIAARAAVTLTAITALSGGAAAAASASSHPSDDQLSISAQSRNKLTPPEMRESLESLEKLRDTIEKLQKDCLLRDGTQISGDELKFRCHDAIQEGKNVLKRIAASGSQEIDALKEALDAAEKKLNNATNSEMTVDITSDVLLHIAGAAIAGILGGAVGFSRSRSEG